MTDKLLNVFALFLMLNHDMHAVRCCRAVKIKEQHIVNEDDGVPAPMKVSVKRADLRKQIKNKIENKEVKITNRLNGTEEYMSARCSAFSLDLLKKYSAFTLRWGENGTLVFGLGPDTKDPKIRIELPCAKEVGYEMYTSKRTGVSGLIVPGINIYGAVFGGKFQLANPIVRMTFWCGNAYAENEMRGNDILSNQEKKRYEDIISFDQLVENSSLLTSIMIVTLPRPKSIEGTSFDYNDQCEDRYTITLDAVDRCALTEQPSGGWACRVTEYLAEPYKINDQYFQEKIVKRDDHNRKVIEQKVRGILAHHQQQADLLMAQYRDNDDAVDQQKRGSSTVPTISPSIKPNAYM